MVVCPCQLVNFSSVLLSLYMVHGNPYKKGNLVWLHSPAVGRGESKKLYHVWKDCSKRLNVYQIIITISRGSAGTNQYRLCNFIG